MKKYQTAVMSLFFPEMTYIFVCSMSTAGINISLRKISRVESLVDEYNKGEIRSPL